MRFAISLLVFICIASMIGTVVVQDQPHNMYVDQFGPFWVAVFDRFSIWTIYNNWWFLLIMGFLVVSTTLCVIRHAPKMIKDMRSFREYIRGSSLRAFPHKVQIQNPHDTEYNAQQVQAWLKAHHYRFKVRHDENNSQLIAAKKGGSNRLGYIFGHLAIVVICIGGLMDSELPVRLQIWLADKMPFSTTGTIYLKEVPETGFLSDSTLSYRATAQLAEGERTNIAIKQMEPGTGLLQRFPFTLELEKFEIEYYPNGMPSNFESTVRVYDPDTQDSFTRRVVVNEPLRYKGVTVYQLAFDDGGSGLKLQAYPLQSTQAPFEVDSKVGTQSELTLGGQPVGVFFEELRLANIESLSDRPTTDMLDADDPALLDTGPGFDSPLSSFKQHVASVAGSAKDKNAANFHNFGPSVKYRVIGGDGQSLEVHSYMIPHQVGAKIPIFTTLINGGSTINSGAIMMPADERQSLNEFMRLHSALLQPDLVQQAVQRYIQRSWNDPQSEVAQMTAGAVATMLPRFASGGLEKVVEGLPEDQREHFLSLTIPMMQQTIIELRDLLREQAGEPIVQYNADTATREEEWNRLSFVALHNIGALGLPVMLKLNSFDYVPASVFQVSRSSGMYIVYAGSLFLVLGVFTMFYIRDRRIWIWIRPQQGGQGSALDAAMTSQRRNLDFNREFEKFKTSFQRLSS